MAAETTTITNDPTGKTAGTTTRAAAAGGAVGAGIAGGPIAAIIVHVFALMGVDLAPIEWALAAVLGAAGAWITAHEVGRRTPTDQVRERESVLVQQVDATDPELKAAVVAIATAAGLVPDDAPAGVGAHRATGSTAAPGLDDAEGGPVAAQGAVTPPAGSDAADDDLEDPEPIVQPMSLEVPEETDRAGL